MVKDAEANADQDKQKREVAEAKNHAESLIHSTEKNVREHGDKLDPTLKAKIENDIKTLKEALEQDDAGDIQNKTQELMQSAMKIGELMNQQTSQEQAPNQNSEEQSQQSPKNDEEIVDADFEEIKDKE